MAVLTEKQKETIAAIERQFIAVNETNTDIPYSVVDVNKLTAEVRRQKIEKSELNIHNQGMEVVRLELRDKLIEKLNADFKAGDVKLTALNYGNDIKIVLSKDAEKSSYNENIIKVHINGVFNSTEFGNKTVGFEYANGYGGLDGTLTAKTPEEFFALPKIEKDLINLIHKT